MQAADTLGSITATLRAEKTHSPLFTSSSPITPHPQYKLWDFCRTTACGKGRGGEATSWGHVPASTLPKDAVPEDETVPFPWDRCSQTAMGLC